MKPKKNPELDPNRNSRLYFVIGLSMVLFLTWRMLEIKVYPKDEFVASIQSIQKEIPEDIPITRALDLPPPPPPAVAPDVIEVVEDEEVIEETVIESSESDQNTEILELVHVDEVAVAEEVEEVFVPFSVIEEPPIYPGCEGLPKSQRKDCFNKKIQEHIKNNFKYPEIALEMGIQGRVYVSFIIDKNGNVGRIQKRGPDKNLEKEAERIISILPKMTPGKQRDNYVSVPYSIPINFVQRGN